MHCSLLLLSSYWAGWGLEWPGRAADAVAVISMVGRQAGGARGQGRGNGEGSSWRGRLGHTLLGTAATAVAVAVAIL